MCGATQERREEGGCMFVCAVEGGVVPCPVQY